MTGRRYGILKTLFLTVLIGCFFLSAFSAAEEAPCPLLGNWAFNYEPTVSVLVVNEDGTALWKDTEYTWEDDGTFLLLKDKEENELAIRYLAEDDRMLIFLASDYTRTAKDKDEEIFGAWKMDGSYGSSFIFEKDMRFMEDGAFVGRFTLDEDAGTFTLKYEPSYFEDTTCYFIREGDRMTVEYPWTIEPTREEEPAE